MVTLFQYSAVDGPARSWHALLTAPATGQSLAAALGHLAARDPRARESLPIGMPPPIWREQARALLYSAVDGMLADGSFLTDAAAAGAVQQDAPAACEGEAPASSGAPLASLPLSGGSQGSAMLHCLFEREAGVCQDFKAVQGSSVKPAVVLTLGACADVEAAISSMCGQTSPLDLFVLSSIAEARIRVLHVVGRATCTAVKSLWMPSTPLDDTMVCAMANVILTLQAPFLLGCSIGLIRSHIVFLRGDHIPAESVAVLSEEVRRFPGDIVSACAQNIETVTPLVQTAPAAGSLARHGAMPMVVPASLFGNFSVLSDFFPAQFRASTDLWLSAFAAIARSTACRQSALLDACAPVCPAEHASQEMQTKLIQHSSRAYLWPLTDADGDFAVISKSAQAAAGRGALAAAVRSCELLVRDWPHRPQAWNNLGVSLLRTADAMPRDAAGCAVLRRARAALATAQSLAANQDEKVERNAQIVSSMLSQCKLAV